MKLLATPEINRLSFAAVRLVMFALLCLMGNVWAAECSSCEYYFDKLSSVASGSSANIIVDGKIACENLKTEGTLNAKSDTLTNRYYHFTELGTHNFGGTDKRHYINGTPVTGSNVNLDNITKAPEGGYYLYVGSSTNLVQFTVSGGTDYCLVPEPEPGPNATDLVIGFVYFSNDVASAGTHSFVEIYNPKDEDVALTDNYSLHYKNNNSEEFTLDLQGSIPAKHSFLVDMGTTGSSPVSFSQTDYKAGRLDLAEFDQHFETAYGNVTPNGMVALKDSDSNTLDLVGIAADTDDCEGACLTSPASTTGYARKKTDSGYADSDDNSNDFVAVNFSTLDLTKTICLPHNSDDSPLGETLTNAKACPAFAESETIGLQPGSDATGVNFNWYSNNAAGNNASFVRILSSDSETINAGGRDTIDHYGAAPSTTANKFYHRVGVTDLQQGTEYKYQISNDSVNWGPVYDYKTVPEGKSFKFAAVTDAQINVGASASNECLNKNCAQAWQSVVTKLEKNDVNFIVHVGDQVDALSGIDKEYPAFFSPLQLRSIPFAPVMGNHDSHCEFIYRYNLPNEQTWPAPCDSTDSYRMMDKSDDGRFSAGNYYYLYNNILFIGLNTAFYPSDSLAAVSYVQKYDATIKTAKEENADKYDFIVVHHHKSTQTIASHAADKDVEAYVKAGLERIMTENGVSLVLSGHDHINVRSKFLVWDETEQKSVPNETIAHGYNKDFVGDNTGTVYLTLSTASGVKYYDAFASVPTSNPNFPYLADSSTGGAELKKASDTNKGKWLLGMETYKNTKQPEYTIVEVDGGSMKLKTYRNDTGERIDEFVITTANKPKPSPPYEVPSGLTATYGDLLSSVDLPNDWSWEGTGTVGNAGTQTHKARFTPTDIIKYRVVSGIDVPVTVAKAQITITGLSVSNKTYNGNATATITGTAKVNGAIKGDNVTITNGTASFANKNVGIGKTVTFSGFTLGGTAAGNYTLSAQPARITANITAKLVTITGLSASNKAYNGNATATVTGTAKVNGAIEGDNVTVTNGTASFEDKNVGTGKTVTFSGFSLGGTAAGNYTLSAQPASVTANITAKTITITDVTAIDRVYDGTTTVALTGGTLVGVNEDDDVGFTLGTGTIRDAIGERTVTTNIKLSGSDAMNYKLTQPTSIKVNITPYTYTVTFKDHDGTEIETQTVHHGSSATAPTDLIREGYTFTGWDKAFSNVTGNLTVTALYTINTHTVTFKDYDGTELKTQTVEHGSAATAPTNPTRAGYTFTGWNIAFSHVTSNLTVTALYSEIGAPVTYTVTFLDHDGTVLKTQTVNPGASATAPPNPSRTGYTFTRWDTAFSNITDHLSVTAEYAIITHTVIFKDFDGTVLETEIVHHGSSANAPTDPTRAGYTFTGWDKAFSNVTSNLTVTAEYEEITPILPQITKSNLLTPTQNGITLTANTNATIAVYNLSGKLISQQNYNAGNHSISLGHLPKGVYIIQARFGSKGVARNAPTQTTRLTVR